MNDWMNILEDGMNESRMCLAGWWNDGEQQQIEWMNTGRNSMFEWMYDWKIYLAWISQVVKPKQIPWIQ